MNRFKAVVFRNHGFFILPVQCIDRRMMTSVDDGLNFSGDRMMVINSGYYTDSWNLHLLS